jgi:hypothetical protein
MMTTTAKRTAPDTILAIDLGKYKMAGPHDGQCIQRISSCDDKTRFLTRALQ